MPQEYTRRKAKELKIGDQIHIWDDALEITGIEQQGDVFFITVHNTDASESWSSGGEQGFLYGGEEELICKIS